MAGGGELVVRKRKVQLVGKYRGASLTKTHAARGIQLLILVTLDTFGI
jgi:hypothetical protein